MQVSAAILAGSSPYKAARLGVAAEALLDVHGRPMVAWVLDALRGVAPVKAIALVGPPAVTDRFSGQAGLALAQSGASVIESGRAGLAALGEAEWVLFATADIPLLTPAAVADFLARCDAVQADFYYPVVRRGDSERAYPGVERTYATLRDGTFTGGNLLLLRRPAFERLAARGERLIAARKSPLVLSRLIGLTFIIRFLLRRVTVAEAEMKVSRLLAARGRAIITPYPEIGVDVDKESDLELVRRVLAARKEQ